MRCRKKPNARREVASQNARETLLSLIHGYVARKGEYGRSLDPIIDAAVRCAKLKK